MITIAAVVVVLILLAGGALFLFQSRLIYFPRSYTGYQSQLAAVERVDYLSNGNPMVAFIFPKRQASKVPKKIWWLFCGNGSLALDWLPLLENGNLPPDTQYVLFDYPSYGESKGKPHPKTIFQAIDHLNEKLCERWALNLSEIHQRSSAMGNSLGASVALKVAADYRYGQVVAVAPFTSMRDMAQKQVGYFKLLLNHHYDNRQSVRLLFSENAASELTLFHGEQDTFIPISMSRELQALAPPDSVIFHSVPNAGHNDIVSKWSRSALIEILTQP